VHMIDSVGLSYENGADEELGSVVRGLDMSAFSAILALDFEEC